MMPTYSVSNALHEKIKSLAEPFVDTPESVIDRCVDFYISNNKKLNDLPPPEPDSPAEGEPMKFSGNSPPSLTFTKPLEIMLNGVVLSKKDTYWNNLMLAAVKKAAVTVPKEKLKRMILANHIDGQGGQSQGYKYIPEADISVQGQDANAAWKTAFHIVKALGMKVDVVFMWEHKDKAAYPGKQGRFKYAAA